MIGCRLSVAATSAVRTGAPQEHEDRSSAPLVSLQCEDLREYEVDRFVDLNRQLVQDQLLILQRMYGAGKLRI